MQTPFTNVYPNGKILQIEAPPSIDVDGKNQPFLYWSIDGERVADNPVTVTVTHQNTVIVAVYTEGNIVPLVAVVAATTVGVFGILKAFVG